MATTITRVQHNSGSAAAGTSFTASVTNPVAVGNLLVLRLSIGANPTPTFPSGWHNNGAVSNTSLRVQTVSMTATATTHSFAVSWTGSYVSAWELTEWYATGGWPAVPTVDGATNKASSGASTAINVGVPTATQMADELWIVNLGWTGSGQTLSGITAGWTAGDTGTVAGITCAGYYQTTAVTGTPTFAATLSAAEVNIGLSTPFVPIVTCSGSLSLQNPVISSPGYIRNNTAEGGTNTTVVTTANSGGQSGTAFDSIAFANSTFATAAAQSGSLGYAINTGELNWAYTGSSTDVYTRAWIYIPTSTATGGYFRCAGDVVSSVGVAAAATAFAPNGSNWNLEVSNSPSSGTTGSQTGIWTIGAGVISAGQWYRVVTHYHLSATTGLAEAWIFNSSGTQIDYQTSSGTGNTTCSSPYMVFGQTNTGIYYLDNMAVADQSQGAASAWTGLAAISGAVGTVIPTSSGSLTPRKLKLAGTVFNASPAAVTTSGSLTPRKLKMAGTNIPLVTSTGSLTLRKLTETGLTLPKTLSLTDPFSGSSVDSTKWNSWTAGGGTVAESGGTLNVSNPVFLSSWSDAGVVSNAPYDLTGSSVTVNMPDGGDAAISGESASSGLVLESTATEPNQWGPVSVWFVSEAGNLTVYWNPGGGVGNRTGPGHLLAFDPVNHAWLRIREVAGTLYFDTSANGLSWTNQYSTADPVLLSSLYVWVWSTVWGPPSTAKTAKFAWLNVPQATAGSLALHRVLMSGTVTETFTSTGSLKPKKLTEAGTVTETFTSTGGLKPKKLTEAGTSTEIFTGTGSLKPKKLTEAGTAQSFFCSGSLSLRKLTEAGAVQSFSSTGSLSLRKLTVTASAVGIFTCSGSLKLKKLQEQGAVVMVPAGSAFGSLSLRKLTESGTAQSFSCSGGLILRRPSMSGTGAETFSGTGGLTARKLTESGAAQSFSSTGSLSLRKLAEAGTSSEIFAAAGSLATRKLAEAAAGTETFTCTGSLSLHKLQAAGTVTETFTSTGSLALRKLTEAGTTSEVFTGTGLLKLKKLTEPGGTGQSFSCAGSLSMRPMRASGTGTEAFSSAGSVQLPLPEVSGTNSQSLGYVTLKQGRVMVGPSATFSNVLRSPILAGESE
jgi:hypothetical protein